MLTAEHDRRGALPRHHTYPGAHDDRCVKPRQQQPDTPLPRTRHQVRLVPSVNKCHSGSHSVQDLDASLTGEAGISIIFVWAQGPAMGTRTSARLRGVTVAQDKGPLKVSKSEHTQAQGVHASGGLYRYTRSPGVRSIIRCESCVRRGPRLGSRARQNQGCNPGVDQGAPGCSTGVLIPACQQGTLP